MGSHHSDRRQFPTESAALASLAVVTAQSADARLNSLMRVSRTTAPRATIAVEE